MAILIKEVFFSLSSENLLVCLLFFAFLVTFVSLLIAHFYHINILLLWKRNTAEKPSWNF